MKRWLLLFLACLSLAAHAQDTWPRDAKNEIEFTGIIPWPAEAQTEAQRQAVVRCWYEEKLTNMKPAVIYRQRTRSRQTCCGLPDQAYISYERLGRFYQINYHVALTPTDKGLQYYLFNFEWGVAEEDAGFSWNLEDALKLPNNSPRDLESMTIFRNRLAKVLAGW